MRSSLLVSLFLVSTPLLSAQPNSPQTFVLITDFGQLYSNYNWETSDVELTESLGKSLADKVLAGSVESAWPEGISSLTARVENRSIMALYKVYYLTTLKSSVVIVGVKENENRHMPAHMQSEKDFYFVVGHSGVDLTNVKTTTLHTTKPALSSNFAAQLNEIAEDFGSGFVNTTGTLMEEDEDAMVIIYKSLKDLEGSTNQFLLEDLYSATTMFHADFPASTDFEVAIQNYKKLIQQVETTKLTCCETQKMDEYVDGQNRFQPFTVLKSAFSYANMVIEIHIEQGETFDNNGLLVANWWPVLEIYEK